MAIWIKMTAAAMLGAALAVAMTMALSHVQWYSPGNGAAPAGCAAPAQLANGQFTSYYTRGWMPSGATIVMDDGDQWSCNHGRVSVN